MLKRLTTLTNNKKKSPIPASTSTNTSDVPHESASFTSSRGSKKSEKRRNVTLQEACLALKNSNTWSDESFNLDQQLNPLSQPEEGLSHRERLLWLQQRRGRDGTWVRCDHSGCNKWRYLKDVFDPSELPEKWYCELNPGEDFGEVKNSQRLEECNLWDDSYIFSRETIGAVLRIF